MFDIYVINLEERVDRLIQIKEDFIDYNLIFVKAIEDEIGWKGCFLSHKKCIEIAKQKNLKYIIVMEDDCKKKNNFDTNLNIIIEYLNKNINDWNLFLGGVTYVWNFNNLINLSEKINIIEINTGKTTQFIIYNSNCYDYFLNFDIIIPIDKCWHNNLKTLVIVPFITTQYEGYSNIEKKNTSYDSRFNNIEKHLLELIQKDKNNK